MKPEALKELEKTMRERERERKGKEGREREKESQRGRERENKCGKCGIMLLGKSR